jgi:hypothetical protein
MIAITEPHTQFICESKPACLCVPEGGDNAWDECDCFEDDQHSLFRTCAGCEAQLIEIDFETAA